MGTCHQAMALGNRSWPKIGLFRTFIGGIGGSRTSTYSQAKQHPFVGQVAPFRMGHWPNLLSINKSPWGRICEEILKEKVKERPRERKERERRVHRPRQGRLCWWFHFQRGRSFVRRILIQDGYKRQGERCGRA